MNWLALATIFFGGAALGYQWGKLAAYREVKPLLREMAEELNEAQIENTSEQEQVQMLKEMWRTEWRKIQ